MERWHKAGLCGDRGVLCLDCGGGHTNLHMCYKCTALSLTHK